MAIPTSDSTSADSSNPDISPISQSQLINSPEIVLPDAQDGRDRYITIQKVTAETISPLIKRDLSVEGVYEIIDRNFSYPLTAHVGLKFDSRTFSNIPQREFDVKMKKVKVPSNYYPIGGNGLDRRYVFANPDYGANPNTLDVAFVIDKNLNTQTKNLIKRNLKELIFKLISGYTNVRFTVWKTAVDSGQNLVSTVVNQATGEKINGFTYHYSDKFLELETPPITNNALNKTNLIQLLEDVLDEAQITSTNPVPEAQIVNFLFRKSLYSLTDEVGKNPESEVLQGLWTNTVRKVVYFSARQSPQQLDLKSYQDLLNRGREAGVQLYYFNTDPNFSGTRSLRELAKESGGDKFNLAHDSDSKLQQFCDRNFYDNNKIYYGDWDGTFKIAWTDNPAWILYDIITDFNYGLGNHIDSTSIDKWTLYDIGRYCDAVDDDGRFKGVSDGKGGLEPRYSCNIIFYNKDEAYNVLKDIAAIFKGIIYWNTEGFSFFADKKKDPVVYFANANVKDGIFQYTETAKNKRYTSVEITYNDKYDDYKTKVEFVEDVDGIRKFGLNPFKVNAAGCTSRSEARRIGKYILCSSMFESDTVTFTAGLEGAYLQPGDIFAISDEVRNVGRTFGRILEVDETLKKIKIDGEFHPDLASGIYIHIPSGNFSVSDLNNLTGTDKNFTGTLEQIRARRQKQTRKFNISQTGEIGGVANSYGTEITITGDFLMQSVVTDVYPIEGRISGANYTGQTVLTGITYVFPEQTVAEGNPRWDTLTFSNVSEVLSNLEIDVDFQGIAGTGQLIGSEPNWTCYVSGANGTVQVNGSTVGSAAANLTAIALNSAGTFITQSSTNASLSDIETFINARTDGQVVVIVSNGTPIASNTSIPSVFASYAATEIYKLGADSSTTINCCYVAALIKGEYRILERASKTSNDIGSLLFTYRNLLAFSRLRPYYTIVQADLGNRGESYYEEWMPGRAYDAGNIVRHSSDTYICVQSHTQSSTNFSDDYINSFTRQCDIQINNKNIGMTVQAVEEVGGIAAGMKVSGNGIPQGAIVTAVNAKLDHENQVFFSIDLNPTQTSSNTTITFQSRTVGGNDVSSSKWIRGNNLGYYTVGFPKNFYGSEKVYLNTSLTSTNVANAFKAIGLNNIYVNNNGYLGQSNLKLLPEANGIGYSGLIYGTGYPKGFYDLSVNTSPQNFDLIQEGSLYVLSGSGVEPKLYKTIAVKEEEANQYSLVGIEFLQDKENLIEKEILDTSPSYYVKGPYDIIGSLKPQAPQAVSEIVKVFDGSIPTGIRLTWGASPSQIEGYRVYVSRPDFSTKDEKDSITEGYSVASNITTLTVPTNQIYGQYDFSVYAQGPVYKLLSEPVQKSIVVLPNPTLQINGQTVTNVLVSGMSVDTADKNSIKYTLDHLVGLGEGNFTSRDVVFRWKYIDPTGGTMSTKDEILENPFLDLPQDVTVEVLDSVGSVLHKEEKYQGLSYIVSSEMNAKLFNRTATEANNIVLSRNLGLRVTVKDINGAPRTGTFFATNIKPEYSNIEVIDAFPNSPYYILSGYFGHRTFTGIAIWNPENNTTTGIISGSGIRDSNGGLYRSEDESISLTYDDMVRSFLTATGYNGTGISAVNTYKGVGINYKGLGDPDYEAYAYYYQDLIDHYLKYIDKSIPLSVWAKAHYENNGIAENRTMPRKEGNILGIANLYDINPATLPNTTGFSGISITVLPDKTTKGEIIFNCYNPTSNKDVVSVDIYTGDNKNFSADTINNTNWYRNINLLTTRSYVNTFSIKDGLQDNKWHYFRFVPWDDFGVGSVSNVVSGYYEPAPDEKTTASLNKISLDGGKNQTNLITVNASTKLISGFNYKIEEVGNVNWTSIGSDGAVVGTVFKYNGVQIALSGGANAGKVSRSETIYIFPEANLNSINILDPVSDSSISMPSSATDGTTVTLINRGLYNVYILDSQNKQISILRPIETASLLRDRGEWIDPRGYGLSLE